jgi:hypothetical protein
MITFTPLEGMSDVVMLFYPQPTSAEKALIQMTIHDAEHYTAEERERIIAGYPAHQRNARAYGIPTMGDGAIFPVAEEDVKCEAFKIPPHFRRIAGLDFGADHPTACVWLAQDPDSGVVYVTDVYKKSGTSAEGGPIMHAAAIKARGEWIPVAWPKDGLNETAAGPMLKRQYEAQGVNMLADHAQFVRMEAKDQASPVSLVSVEAGLHELLMLMQEGKLKVFEHLESWFMEFRSYHRKKGKVVKMHDDVMDAMRYGFMMLRFAKPQTTRNVLSSRRFFNWRAG